MAESQGRKIAVRHRLGEPELHDLPILLLEPPRLPCRRFQKAVRADGSAHVVRFDFRRLSAHDTQGRANA